MNSIAIMAILIFSGSPSIQILPFWPTKSLHMVFSLIREIIDPPFPMTRGTLVGEISMIWPPDNFRDP